MMLDDVGGEVVSLDYKALPRKRTCGTCLGSGREGCDAGVTTCGFCSGLGVLMPAYLTFETETVRPVGTFKRAPWVVTIDDHPYAGFVDEAHAVAAAKMWLGYIDGLGRIVTEKADHPHWPACDGRVVRVVRQGQHYQMDSYE